MDIARLDELYKLYRFEILSIPNDSIRVYSYSNQYFSNADIILLKKINEKEINRVISDIENLGFSTTVRSYKTIEDAEQNLFEGFFDFKRSNQIQKRLYNEYVSKVEKVIFGNYEYVNSEYYDVETNQLRNDSIVNTIFENLNRKGPVLVLLEAAAGFGKTSTSYEILKSFTEDTNSLKIPLFTELSRNRQASIFKYVLYDEINRRFTGLNLEVVISQISEGRVPLIIDGFDELLKPKSLERTEDKFEDAEPMLQTIKELLKGDSKILLTTRRTAIFSDDDFFKWLEENDSDFEFYRYSITEPTITDWIPPTREKDLQKAGLNLKSISNPVLLSYLKGMNEEQFLICINDIDLIIEDYIYKLMERENDRQDLNMSVEEQKAILKIISNHLTNSDVTSESKEILEKKIFEKEHRLLFNVLDRFSPSTRPTIDQLTNKLIIHAFLDRKADSAHQIGFVNDFILGSFVGANLLDEKENWIGTERFIDFILTAYTSRSKKTKHEVYTLLNKELVGYLDITKQVFIDNYLFGCINRNIENSFFNDLEFRKCFNNNKVITNCIFSDCQFYDVDFSNEFLEVKNTFFINCNFFNCFFPHDIISVNEINFTNCTSDSSDNFLKSEVNSENENYILSQEEYYERKVLEKFWQNGKDSFMPHKRIGTLRLGIPSQEISFIDTAIESLIKRNIIIQRRGHFSVQLNVQHINEIKKILGR